MSPTLTCSVLLKSITPFTVVYIMYYVNILRSTRISVKDYASNKDKRPRGLDILVGYLPVKLIPVMYKLSSTKIPEYLSQK